jgi:hypothetical protein
MSRTHVLISFLVVLTFVAGLLTSSAFHAHSTDAAGRLLGGEPLSTPSQDSELVNVLGSLRAELSRLNDHLLRGSQTPSSGSTERRREPDANSEVLGELRELTSVLKSLSARMATSPGTSSFDLRPPALDAKRPPVPVTAPERQEDFERIHLFWTYQQVLDRYGRPDEIQPRENAQSWWYRESGRVIGFTFSQGFVISTYVN